MADSGSLGDDGHVQTARTHHWHHVPSFLKPKEPAKMSVLSKAWLSTWLTPQLSCIDSLKIAVKLFEFPALTPDHVNTWLQNAVDNGGRNLEFLYTLVILRCLKNNF